MITKSNIKDVSLTSNPESINFCGVWPSAREGLKLLQSIVKDPFLKGSITMIISIGDHLCNDKK
ncbi:hypothetical protein [uncultured Chryseobacterium sp.]|uniref:hypothetical protein n=1 Tax=uncultured Chryseobacterium sp. TaxID=259322 RepID=UPI0025D9B522|nr:hypothetical protein [uncultured Chryseobacterium sp.]